MTRRSIILCSVLALVGCDKLWKGSGDPGCDSAATFQSLDGRWVIEGRGTRSGCNDDRYEGDFTLGPSKEIALTFAERVSNPAIHDLAPTSPPAGFSAGGDAQGTCVNFNTTESWETSTVTYTFTGEFEPPSRVTGSFTGRGPGSCTVSGTYTVSIRR